VYYCQVWDSSSEWVF
nr:immunoglobulin light chain junction region [Macaca mulatta]MOV68422.1 immunoglobulin light chain junction region [Macaca mulatta]MOV68439.1 immunoglobulin light chain junction region [Macaca mulatta]MOV68465.1 immunoglobulin light chain junction region [Macaca mulatta]MOV68482.1 immunoglobulin light chain junction region [Macaca mulatta]